MAKYSDYNKIFSVENIAELLENIKMNEHAIKLEEDKQPLFSQIYSSELVELEILKIYIKTNLTNSFIWPFQSLIKRSIFFNKKLDKSLYLCINY